MLLCPPGGLSQEQVSVELSPAHDRRPLPEGDKTITAIWETRLQAQPWIFDAPKFRLHSAILASSSPEPQLLLHLGLTSYRDFLGTNWSSSASWLRQQGATDWGDKQAYLADPLGVGAALVTADDFLVFLHRSQQVAEAPGLVDVPGGHPEPQVQGLKVQALLVLVSCSRKGKTSLVFLSLRSPMMHALLEENVWAQLSTAHDSSLLGGDRVLAAFWETQP